MHHVCLPVLNWVCWGGGNGGDLNLDTALVCSSQVSHLWLPWNSRWVSRLCSLAGMNTRGFSGDSMKQVWFFERAQVIVIPITGSRDLPWLLLHIKTLLLCFSNMQEHRRYNAASQWYPVLISAAQLAFFKGPHLYFLSSVCLVPSSVLMAFLFSSLILYFLICSHCAVSPVSLGLHLYTRCLIQCIYLFFLLLTLTFTF